MTELTKPVDLTQPNSAERDLATKGTANFHQALQLLHGSSDAVRDGKGKPGEYLLDDLNLSNSVPIIICGQRFHAIYLKNKVREMESFDFSSEITKKIVSLKRDYNSGEDPRFGYSFLVYLPEHHKFGVFHPNVPSARPVSKDIIDYWTPPDKREKAAKDLPHTNCLILSSFLRESRNPHYVPKVTPIEPNPEWFPSEEQMKSALEIFSAPVLSERQAPKVEKATDSDDR